MEDIFIQTKVNIDDRLIQKFAETVCALETEADLHSAYLCYEQQSIQMKRLIKMEESQRQENIFYINKQEKINNEILEIESRIKEKQKIFSDLQEKKKKDDILDKIAKKINNFEPAHLIEEKIISENNLIQSLQIEATEIQEKYNQKLKKASEWTEMLEKIISEF